MRRMEDHPIPPSSEDLQALLKPLTLRHLTALSALSEVPVSTLYKIRSGDTPNPGIETVRSFMPHIKAAVAAADAPASQLDEAKV
jgi:predicted transcriptional regulator